MNLVTEDAESAAHVKVGSNNQNPTAFHLSQAVGRVERFVGGREPENGTDPHRLRLETILQIPGLTPDRHWTGIDGEATFSLMRLMPSSSDSAALQPHRQKRSSPLPKSFRNSRSNPRQYGSRYRATSTREITACTEVTRSQAESVRSFWIGKDVGGSLCDPVRTCVDWQSSCC